MQILTECNLAKIVSELIFGKIFVFPTETSYGLSCDATNQSAVNKVFSIKGRPDNKPLLVVVPSVENAKKILKWNDILEKLSAKYWPGPLTVVGEAAEARSWVPSLAKGVVSEDETVAVRVTNFPFLRSVTEKLGRPLVATSANFAGSPDNYSANEVLRSFKDKQQPDYLLNQGEIPKNPPTTIVRVYNDRFVVLRQGELKVQL